MRQNECVSGSEFQSDASAVGADLDKTGCSKDVNDVHLLAASTFRQLTTNRLSNGHLALMRMCRGVFHLMIEHSFQAVD